ncbi:sperm motility kinase 2B-like [Dipodomys spectabilis]|uniref:sperm motility kinase 2B-like n=1 Tax=Dipodomys spectabilis TaxID=105255 RepID=UPI001C53527B|nr:sperm motility kinase 2B-like [Dipodomys spectabilis]
MESKDSEYTMFSSTEEEIFARQYHVQQTIGYGTFGQVKKAYHCLTDSEVAVKILGKEEYPMLVDNEVEIVKALNHPHMIRVYQVIQGEEYVYLVMEMATKGNLQMWIEESGHLFEAEARRFLKQIVSAVQYFHVNQIAHLDLKPDNILLDGNGNAKVSDFGLSMRIAPGQLLTEIRGAYVYRAPEIYLRQQYNGFKVDVWCLGTILLFMVTGNFPFKGSTSNQLCAEIVEGRYDVPSHLTPKGCNILWQLLTVDPQQRPDIHQIMVHPWFDQVEEGCLYPEEPLPDQLDPTIVTRMCDMGYSKAQIKKSVLQRAFDDVMATYFMIKDGLEAVRVSQVKANSEYLDFQTHTPAFLLYRRANLPYLIHSLPLPSQFLLTCDEKQRTGRSASLPAIPLCFLQTNSSPRIISQHDLVPAFYCFSLPKSHEGRESSKANAKSLPSAQPQDENRVWRLSKSQSCKEPGMGLRRYSWYGSKELPGEAEQKVDIAVIPAYSAKTSGCSCFGHRDSTSEEYVLPSGQSQNDSRDSGSRRKRGRKGLFTRITSALRKLCCCLQAQ